MLPKKVVFNNNDDMKIVIILKGFVVAKDYVFIFFFSVQSDAIFVIVALTVVLVAEYKTPQSTIRRTACARAQFSGYSSTTNAHSETGQMAVCCQNLPLGAFSSHSASSVLVGELFKKFGLFLNTRSFRKMR
jgi:hypothetical protein